MSATFLILAGFAPVARVSPLAASAPLAPEEITDADLEHASAGRLVAVGALSRGGQVASVPLEVYVARVLAGEAEPGAPDAALQALAVAVRTFAIVNAGRHRRDGFDLCDTTHCQVPRNANAATRRAALATAGRVLTFGGTPAQVFYSASCGGRSETASEVWPGARFPYLTSIVDDVHDGDVPWTLEIPLEEIRRALQRVGFEGRELYDVRVETRSASGRAARIALPGLEPSIVAGDQLRGAIGPGELRSTAFSVSRHGKDVAFTGRGYGHGVGLCVIGAGRRARRGETAEAILAAYYPALAVARLD